MQRLTPCIFYAATPQALMSGKRVSAYLRLSGPTTHRYEHDQVYRFFFIYCLTIGTRRLQYVFFFLLLSDFFIYHLHDICYLQTARDD